MGQQSLLVNDLRPNVLLPQRLANSSPVSDGPLEAGLLDTDSSDSDSGPPFLQVSCTPSVSKNADFYLNVFTMLD